VSVELPDPGEDKNDQGGGEQRKVKAEIMVPEDAEHRKDQHPEEKRERQAQVKEKYRDEHGDRPISDHRVMKAHFVKEAIWDAHQEPHDAEKYNRYTYVVDLLVGLVLMTDGVVVIPLLKCFHE
jgi:hypothetical protein